MRRLPLLAALPLVALVLVAASPRKKPPADTDVPATSTPAPPSAPPSYGAMFPGPLPIAVGGVPKGLANLSAQGCNACHYDAHDGWARSGHGRATEDAAWRAAVAAAGTPACTTCHLPIDVQQPDLVQYESGDVDHPDTEPNPKWDATLAGEGVTCAVCHVRDGKIVAAQPVDASAPHPTTWSADLRSSKLCATCHELTWPGANQPYYDTYGEWERSPQAKAGIQCQDCHLRAGVGGQVGADHSFPSDPARAVSLLVDVDRDAIVRGGSPLDVTVRLQNTGAGHAFPTGSPYRGVRLQAVLWGPVGKKGEPGPSGTPFVQDLARKVGDAAPWPILADERLPAGGSAQWKWQAALPKDALAGDWSLRVTLAETLRGEPVGEPFVLRTIPLRSD